MDREGDRRPALLRGDLPDSLRRRHVTIPTGTRQDYVESDWQDSLVIVEHGSIELEEHSGARHLFKEGDILTLSGLPLRALCTRGSEAVVLAVISRRSEANSPDQR